MGIYKAIKHSDNRYRFHMPGHSGRRLNIDASYDITELSYSDNLLAPNGAILDTENKIAKFYESRYALLFTCGATSAIAAVMTMLKQIFAEPILYACGKTHKSTHAQAEINDIQITETMDDANVLFNTSPDYYGNYSDGYGVGDKNKRLSIIDAAHAAHYPLINKKIDTDLYDIIIYSLHKTLPVYTGAAVIVTNNAALYEQLLLARSRTHTTSPSYLIMASVDKFINNLSSQKIYKLKNKYNIIKRYIDDMACKCRYKIYYTDDFTRLTIDVCKSDGEEIKKYLETKGIYVEAVFADKIVLIITPYNYKYLNKVVKNLNRHQPICSIKSYEEFSIDLTYNASKIGSICFIDIDKSLGKTLYQEIGIYPPGVPILLKGAIINKEAIEYITRNKEKCFGLVNGKLAVYAD